MRKTEILGISLIVAMLGPFLGYGAYSTYLNVINERKKIYEAETREQVLEATKRIHISVDTRMKIVSYVGDETIFGYQEKELLGKPVRVLIPKGLLEGHSYIVQKRFRETRKNAFTRVIITKGLRKDGSIVPIENHLTVFPAENEARVRATAWFVRIED